MGVVKGDVAGLAVYLFYDGLAAFAAKSPPWGIVGASCIDLRC